MKQKISIVGQRYKNKDPYLPGIRAGVDVVLVREPDNPVDPNAVGVWIDGEQVGYLPKEKNAGVARIIDMMGADVGELAMDAKPTGAKFLRATLRRSPNTGYPQIEVEVDG